MPGKFEDNCCGKGVIAMKKVRANASLDIVAFQISV